MGLRSGDYRVEPLLRRIPACLRVLKSDSLAEASLLLDRQPAMLPRALGALLIGTTGFFRDRPVFEALEEKFIPSLLREHPHPRVWSTACSEGAELYSVAMILSKLGALERVTLLGSDCRPAALERARPGIFPRAAAEDLPGHYRSLLLPAEGGSLQVAPELRRAVRWRAGDILREDCRGTWDMILCRNLAIYLRPESSVRLWQKLAAALAPGGLLVVGKAEKPCLPNLRKAGPSIYRKVSFPVATE